MLPITMPDGDMGVGDRLDAGVGDDTARDIGAKVFDRIVATAEGLDVDAPFLAPHGGITLPALGSHPLFEGGAKRS